MPSAWHNFVEPALRRVRPAFDPLEDTGLFKWLRRHVRRIREERGGLPPIADAPRRVTLEQLKPVFDLKKRHEDGSATTSWQATGVDPQFVADCHIKHGWAHLHIELEADVPAHVELYVDTGRGFNPRERFELSELTRKVSLDGYLRLPLRTRRVRLDPLNRRGTFTVRAFEIAHVSRWTLLSKSFALWHRRVVREPARQTPLGYVLTRVLQGDGADLLQEILSASIVARVSESVAYARWRTRNTLTRARRRSLKQRLARLNSTPRLSIIVPVYNAPIKYLRRCIESVRAQLYPHWELCLADDASPNPAVRKLLARYAALDPRIKVVYRKTNGNISAASNSALDLASGDYVALLDNDDELEPHAMALAALFIAADPTVDALYSDEDKVDIEGRHFDPFFKPDWSPEYFLAGMYTCHLGIFRRSLVQAVGRFRSEYDGSQDYDLALRIFARTNRIRHIPDILYHWRTLPTSTAARTDAKPAAYEAARQALSSNLHERGLKAVVEHGASLGYYRVKFALTSQPKVSIIVPLPTYAVSTTRRSLIKYCMDQLPAGLGYSDVEILAVGTTNPHVEGVRFVAAQGADTWAARANLGAQVSRGETLVFMSPYVKARTPGWLPELLSLTQQEHIGAVGVKIYDRNGRLSHVGLVLARGAVRRPYLGFPDDFPGYNCTNLVLRNWSAVRDACLATRRDVFVALGGFDAADGEQADVGYCLRLRRRGLRVVWTPYVELTDYDRTSEHERTTLPVVRERFRRALPVDPYYNINLVREAPLFRVEPQPATVLP